MRTERFVLSTAGSVETLAGSSSFHRSLIEGCRVNDGASAQRSTFNALAAGLMAFGEILDPERARDWLWLTEPSTG